MPNVKLLNSVFLVLYKTYNVFNYGDEWRNIDSFSKLNIKKSLNMYLKKNVGTLTRTFFGTSRKLLFFNDFG